MKFISLIIILCISIIGFGQCLYVEILNQKHGNYLPRQDIFPEANNNSWRELSIEAAKKRWRKNNFAQEREDFLEFKLSNNQLLEQEKYLDFVRSEHNFQNQVRRSLILYLLIPIFFLMTFFDCLKKFGKSKISLHLIIFILNIASCYIMISRGFLTAILAD